MDSNGSEAPAARRTPLRGTADNALKIVVVGGFGVGKTTLVGAVSEIRPLNTEETMTKAGEGIDDPSGAWGKRSTTVAFDFGRITLSASQVLYLFGAPGQERFWFLWDRLFSGALGAVVLVDTRRLEESWYAIDRLEHHGTPFIVARNNFGEPTHTLEQVRGALDLPADVPLVDCDARDRESSKQVLIELVRHLAARVEEAASVEEATRTGAGAHDESPAGGADTAPSRDSYGGADTARSADSPRGAGPGEAGAALPATEGITDPSLYEECTP